MSLIPALGRPASLIGFRLVRPLELQDLMRLSVGKDLARVGVPTPKRLRAVHHRAAELLASGVRIADVARRVGLTPQRITQLQESPDFCDLVAYFSSQIQESTIEIRQRIEEVTIDNAEMATYEMNRRLEAEPEKIGIAELRQIAAMSLDRTVLPPKPAQAPAPAVMNVTFKIGNRDIQPKIIEGEEQELQQPQELLPSKRSEPEHENE